MPTKRRKALKFNLNNSAPDDLIFGFNAIQGALEVPVSRVIDIWISDQRKDIRVSALIHAAQQHGINPNKFLRTIWMKWCQVQTIKVALPAANR